MSPRMHIRTRCTAIASLTVCAIFVQTAMAADHFDVVSVKPADTPIGGVRRHSPGRISYTQISFAELIMRAFAPATSTSYFNVQYQVVWPEWMPIARDHVPKEKLDFRFFTIDATMPPETSPAEFRLMLQNLLVDRFGLVFHRETRPLAQYDLTFVEGGPKMPKATPRPGGPPTDLPPDSENLLESAQRSNSQKTGFGEFGYRVWGDFSVAEIAVAFETHLQHPLVDRTGSADLYTIDITWGWNPGRQIQGVPMVRATDGEARELFSIMEKKLGLKATLRTVPTEFIVIDHLNHEATEN